jgi:hypothetical protein
LPRGVEWKVRHGSKERVSQTTVVPETSPEASPPGSGTAAHSRAHELRRYWLERAFANAGIEASHWDPARGVDANRRTIERVYDYYGRLYERHARLQWAGMANLIGPSFYAGFLDIGIIPDAERRLTASLRRLIWAGRHGVEALLQRDQTRDESVNEGLGFFEITFLTMQRKIFEDQALMHEAYLGGGLDTIRALGSAGIIDEATVQAWEQIDGGHPARIQEGNRTLLYREQHDIIDRFYANMRAYDPPQGKAFTYLLTLAGSPAVPGARGYTAVFPVTVDAPIPGGAVSVRTPLAEGNIAVFANRWALIEQDTLPAYQRFITADAAQAGGLIATPIEKRVGRFRLLRRLGIIEIALLTHWGIRFEGQPAAPRRLGVSRRTPAPVAAAAGVTIDLTGPPTRATAGFSSLSDHRAWASAGAPFQLTVQLPRDRAYVAVAQLAVLLSPALGGNPSRLTVKLPSTDLEGAHATLAELASEWNADATEVERWAAAAARVTLDEHAYSTRVFRAEPIDFVRLEFQVEHHVEEGDYVLDALFSWDEGPVAART